MPKELFYNLTAFRSVTRCCCCCCRRLVDTFRKEGQREQEAIVCSGGRSSMEVRVCKIFFPSEIFPDSVNEVRSGDFPFGKRCFGRGFFTGTQFLIQTLLDGMC